VLCQSSKDISISGYLVDTKNYEEIFTGLIHPLCVLEKLSRSAWWEDIWNPTMTGSYWDGYDSLKKPILG